MKASSLRTGTVSPEVKAELRRRILEIVNRKTQLTDLEIWRESAPNYFPWRAMIEEIKALDKEKKLRLEIPEPGHWIIHSEVSPAAPKPAGAAVKKAKVTKAEKRSKAAAKKAGA